MMTVRELIESFDINEYLPRDLRDQYVLDDVPAENEKVRAHFRDAFDAEILELETDSVCGLAIIRLIESAFRIFAISHEYDVRVRVRRAIVDAANVIYFG
jgi:hypothetical protein